MALLRTFVALELPGVVAKALAAIIDRLKVTTGGVRWVRPEGIHLTLKFLGDVEEARIPEIVAAVQQSAGKAALFTLETSDVGGFPGLDRARVLWVGLGGDLEALEGLQQEVERALGSLGFPPEQRKFFPHLTLGRARRHPVKIAANPAGAVKTVSFRPDRVAVMKSDLQPDGAVYTALGYGMLKRDA